MVGSVIRCALITKPLRDFVHRRILYRVIKTPVHRLHGTVGAKLVTSALVCTVVGASTPGLFSLPLFTPPLARQSAPASELPISDSGTSTLWPQQSNFVFLSALAPLADALEIELPTLQLESVSVSGISDLLFVESQIVPEKISSTDVPEPASIWIFIVAILIMISCKLPSTWAQLAYRRIGLS